MYYFIPHHGIVYAMIWFLFIVRLVQIIPTNISTNDPIQTNAMGDTDAIIDELHLQ